MMFANIIFEFARFHGWNLKMQAVEFIHAKRVLIMAVVQASGQTCEVQHALIFEGESFDYWYDF
ncbi:hypothetical protein BGI37_02185 [Snodgrassella alvi]|jgi:hypothetical protein|uniref:Uncharacterized protein n=1 Tax=Snodgrassella alvi TaxID=1196083 RepID=A0A855FNE0_9NEIS|nr:hypothetical protein BGI37_02185 [Snodgrassella alvi]PIT59897.1 hypothetical protein BHC57_06365 [Snodgrassella alvi]